MTNDPAVDEVRILSPTAILGYGFPESSFQAGLARQPHLIAVDAGSTDPGPRTAGDIGETDVYGAQQHAPLLGLVIELPATG